MESWTTRSVLSRSAATVSVEPRLVERRPVLVVADVHVDHRRAGGLAPLGGRDQLVQRRRQLRAVGLGGLGARRRHGDEQVSHGRAEPILAVAVRGPAGRMRAVLQRAISASVTVDGEVVGRIDEPGLVVLLGITHDDGPAEVAWLARKIRDLRIMREERSVADLGAPVLVVSQFTLYGDARKGRRPTWSAAAPGAVSEPLYERCARRWRSWAPRSSAGVFGADMAVSLVNDGPVTMVLEHCRRPSAQPARPSWISLIAVVSRGPFATRGSRARPSRSGRPRHPDAAAGRGRSADAAQPLHHLGGRPIVQRTRRDPVVLGEAVGRRSTRRSSRSPGSGPTSPIGRRPRPSAA